MLHNAPSGTFGGLIGPSTKVKTGRMKILKRAFAVGLAVAGLAASYTLSGQALAQEKDPVVFKVNGQEVRASEIAIAKDEVLPHLGNLPPKARYPFIVDYLIESALQKSGVDRRNRNYSLCSKSCRKSHSMFFGNSYIIIILWNFFFKNI